MCQQLYDCLQRKSADWWYQCESCRGLFPGEPHTICRIWRREFFLYSHECYASWCSGY